jgi:hypothetical protein
MPIETRWLYPGRVYIVESVGHISLDDVEETVKAQVKFLQEGEAPIYCITNNLGVESFPMSAARLADSSMKLKAESHKLGDILIIDKSATLRFLSTIIGQLAMQKRIRSVTSVAEAIAYIQRIEPALAGMEWPQASGN